MMPAPVSPGLDWSSPEIAALIRAALDEDLGKGRTPKPADLTAEAIASPEQRASAGIVAKQNLVLAGLPLAEQVFRALDPASRFDAQFEEGAEVPAGSVVARVAGRARAILSAERTALNFLAHLCGIATLTRQFVEAIRGTPARIRDTRKTTPLYRALEKYAVRIGGGANHRFGLFDAVLIKENHIAIAGSAGEALRRVRASPTASRAPIQVEVCNETELREALASAADGVLLDNLAPQAAAQLIAIARKQRPTCLIEVSGNVSLANVRAYAEAGADFISIGALTHSAPAADLSLLLDPQR
jgi:nicotinate-nucleotide pyrophosphorylase (carboxylating)